MPKSANGWESYRKDCGNGGMADFAMDAPVRLLWKQNAGEMFKNEVVHSGGLVFVCSNDLKVFEEDGDYFWGIETPSAISSTPCVQGNTVVLGCEDGHVIGVDIKKRTEIWRVKTKGKIAQGICVSDDVCYLGNSFGELVAFDVLDGKQLYLAALDVPVSFGPVKSGGVLIIGDDNGNLYSIDFKTGNIFWKKSVAKSKIGGITLFGDRAYFGSHDNNVYCVDTQKGEILWSVKTSAWIEKTPVVYDDTLFVKVSHSYIVGYNRSTGEQTLMLETQPSDAEMTLSGDNLYYGNNRRLDTLNLKTMKVDYYFEFVDEQISSISMSEGKVFVALGNRVDRIGRVACLVPEGHVEVRPQIVSLTVKTTDKDPYFELEILNSRNDSWKSEIQVGLYKDADWLMIDKPIVNLGNNQSEKIRISIDPTHPGVVGENKTEIIIEQVVKHTNAIGLSSLQMKDDNQNNSRILTVPVFITVEDPIAPRLCETTKEINIGLISNSSIGKYAIGLSNCGGRDMEVNLETTSFPKWLSVIPEKLTIPPDGTSIVTVVATGSSMDPEPGYKCDFLGSLTIRTNTNEKTRTIPCKVKCYGIPIPTRLSLIVGSPDVLICGKQKTYEPPPYIFEGRTMVPLRLIAEAFFTDVSWNPSDRSITINSCEDTIRFWIDSQTVSIVSDRGTKEVEIDTAPQIVDGRTFIPIRAVSEILGGSVSWDGPTRTVSILYSP